MNVVEMKQLTEEEIKKLDIVYMYMQLTDQQKWLVQNQNNTSNCFSPVFNASGYSKQKAWIRSKLISDDNDDKQYWMY